MIEREQLPVLIKILQDYISCRGKKQYQYEAEKMVKDLEEDRATRRKERRERSIKISKKALADELGIDQQTMMNRIMNDEPLVLALFDIGWTRDGRKGFYKGEKNLIKQRFEGKDPDGVFEKHQ
jgi:hypothetical protein